MGSLSKGIGNVMGMGMGNYYPTAQPTRVVAVTSGKGGVGKTTVSINLAVALATLGRDVVLLDADLGLANVDVLLGLHADRSLMHVVAGECGLADVIVTGPAGVRIVPAASGFEHMAELGSQQRAGVIAAFSQLENSADFMIVDTAAGIGGATLDFCDASHEVLVVVCDDPASMTDAYATIKVLNQRSGRRRFRVLVNNTRDEGGALRVYRRLLEVTDRYLDVSLDFAGQIPHDAHVRTAARRRQALLEWAPASRAGAAFKNLANTTDKWPVPRSASGRMEFFVERMARMDSLERVASL